MAYIEVIQPENATGDLKVIYDEILKQRGKIAEVLKIQSLNPAGLKTHLDMYMAIMFKQSPIKRYLRETLAVVVSCANNCTYCSTHHSHAVNHFWKDEKKTGELCSDYTSVPLTDFDRAFCDYAWQLTTAPHTKIGIKTKIDALKKLGATDREILDVAQIVSYFNFVNRMVLGLGVDLEPENESKGFIYE